jgi:hypothetical protein
LSAKHIAHIVCSKVVQHLLQLGSVLKLRSMVFELN